MLQQKQLATTILKELNSSKYEKLLYVKYPNNYVTSNSHKHETHGIVTVNLSNSNTIINLSDLKGNCILKCSSGLVNYRGNEKIRKYALVSSLKNIIDQSSKLNYKSIALHFRGLKRYRSLVINLLKKKFFLVIVKHTYKLPHNGCRPKKAKRL